ncbi:MAG: methyltransferase domain-containing protein [Planctomycetota bacterium]
MSGSEIGSRAHRREPAIAIRFPRANGKLDQDEEWFEFELDGRTRRLRIHEYAEMYGVPGLYEALVYDKLRCNSPRRMAELLASVLSDRPEDIADLRVLDLGAGNGIVAEELKKRGIRSIVGLDLLPEAAAAARRDRPDVYRDYVVADLCDLEDEDRRRLERAKLNCLITVAALGFGDIPPEAFATAFNLISARGWLGMTIKEGFLQPGGDDSGFARLIRELVDQGIVEIQAHLRFRHRLSIEGEPIFYVAIVARKTADIPSSLIGGVKAGAEIETLRRADAASLLLGRT